jgi:hypothetical protein
MSTSALTDTDHTPYMYVKIAENSEGIIISTHLLNLNLRSFKIEADDDAVAFCSCVSAVVIGGMTMTVRRRGWSVTQMDPNKNNISQE